LKFSYINFCEGHEIESIFHTPESGTDEYIEIRIPLTVDVIGAVNQIERWRGEHELAFVVVPEESYAVITRTIQPEVPHVCGAGNGAAIAEALANVDGVKLFDMPLRFVASVLVGLTQDDLHEHRESTNREEVHDRIRKIFLRRPRRYCYLQ
jgi:hypothetical protein